MDPAGTAASALTVGEAPLEKLPDSSFAPSETAETMYSSRRNRRTSVHTDLEFVRDNIGAESWPTDEPLPQTPARFVVRGLSEQAVQDAYEAYRSNIKL